MAGQEAWKKLAEYDRKLREQYGEVLCGTDECGRGAFAGPIAAGAAILPADAELLGLNDSKKMTEAARVKLAEDIKQVALGWSVAYISPEDIDKKGLTWANTTVMVRAALAAVKMACEKDPDLMVDLFVIDQSPCTRLTPYKMLPKADGTSLCVAAASVLVKTARDALMAELEEKYPQFSLSVHKGYVRPDHVAEVNAHGRVKGLHRFSYNVKGLKDDGYKKDTTFFDALDELDEMRDL